MNEVVKSQLRLSKALHDLANYWRGQAVIWEEVSEKCQALIVYCRKVQERRVAKS